jgi:hypothetical protein
MHANFRSYYLTEEFRIFWQSEIHYYWDFCVFITEGWSRHNIYHAREIKEHLYSGTKRKFYRNVTI